MLLLLNNNLENCLSSQYLNLTKLTQEPTLLIIIFILSILKLKAFLNSRNAVCLLYKIWEINKKKAEITCPLQFTSLPIIITNLNYSQEKFLLCNFNDYNHFLIVKEYKTPFLKRLKKLITHFPQRVKESI